MTFCFLSKICFFTGHAVYYFTIFKLFYAPPFRLEALHEECFAGDKMVVAYARSSPTCAVVGMRKIVDGAFHKEML